MITEQEAIKKGMSDFNIAMGILNGDIEPDFSKVTPMRKIHGKVINVEQTAYHDITTYEDGYQDYYYIGD